jgi:hypothetical protein
VPSRIAGGNLALFAADVPHRGKKSNEADSRT